MTWLSLAVVALCASWWALWAWVVVLAPRAQRRAALRRRLSGQLAHPERVVLERSARLRLVQGGRR
jgi:hypothetical protein